MRRTRTALVEHLSDGKDVLERGSNRSVDRPRPESSAGHVDQREFAREAITLECGLRPPLQDRLSDGIASHHNGSSHPTEVSPRALERQRDNIAEARVDARGEADVCRLLVR